MNDLKLVMRHVYKQLQCGIGCAKSQKNNKIWPHRGFGREGDLASLSSWYDSPFVYTDKYNFSGSQSSFAFFSHGTTINIYVVR